ncbi:MAG: Hpt domain-containing protein [Cellvibrionaceae bacterium]|nr:Hpt domain-containing protein [Cellvibrionaceae bacterium]
MDILPNTRQHPQRLLILSMSLVSYALSFIIHRSAISAMAIAMGVAAMGLTLMYVWSRAQHTHKTEGVTGKTAQLLVLSEDANLQKPLRQAFNKHRLECKTTDKQQRIQRQINTQTVAGILLDITKDFEKSRQLVASIRQQQADKQRIPIIAIERQVDLINKHRILAADFDDFIEKPINEKKLTVVAHRWFSDQHMAEKPLSTAMINQPVSKHALLEADKTATATAPDNDASTASQPIVNIQQSLSYSRNDPALSKDLLNMLITMVQTQKQTIIDAYHQQHWQALRQLSHQLRGACVYCGVPQLEQQAAFMDDALEKHQLQQVEDQFPEFLQAIDALLEWHEQHDIDVLFEP